MRHRLLVVTLAVGMMLEAAAIYHQHQQIGVLSIELYGQSEPTEQENTPAWKRVNRLEDLQQATARLCELSKDSQCAADLGIRKGQ